MSRLHRAARLGEVDEVAKCLARGEDVNAIGIRHFSPLMLAAREGHLSIVLVLLEAGADVHLTHPNGRTTLHFATDGGHLEVVKALVAAGADVNARSKIGCTPAIEAAMFNREPVVSFLREHGADMSIQDREGRTADDWLAEGGIPGRLSKQFPQGFDRTPEQRERTESHLRKLMSEGLSPDEFVAKHGRNILAWGYRGYPFADAEVKRWADRVTEILFTPGLQEECEERFLLGEELEEARRCRASLARYAARLGRRRAKGMG